MTCATLMVHLEVGSSNVRILQVAGDLADRFQAGVIGIAAAQPMQIVYADGYVSGDMIEDDREEKDKEIQAAEAEFRQAFQTRSNDLEWRALVTLNPLSDYLACEARSADLFVTCVDRSKSIFDASRHVEMGDLVMRIGRPVLIVPKTESKITLERMLVGWKDSRETRRAIVDALPLLEKARSVTVAEIAIASQMDEARRRLDQVVQWLKRHGVAAEAVVVASTGRDSAQLGELAREHKADVIVAGAYGHNRVREWMLGGVTRDLLLHADRCALVSH